MTQLIHKHFQAWVVQYLQVDSLVGWKKLFQKTLEYFPTCHARLVNATVYHASIIRLV